MAKVSFHYSDVQFYFPRRQKVKETIEKIFRSHNQKLEKLDYIFCSDQYLLEMNRQWLKHDTYTDIITFDLSSSKSSTVGEVYISVDRVIENASNLSISFQEELRRVIFHGALHLVGLKDKTAAQKEEMRLSENKWLSSFKRST